MRTIREKVPPKESLGMYEKMIGRIKSLLKYPSNEKKYDHWVFIMKEFTNDIANISKGSFTWLIRYIKATYALLLSFPILNRTFKKHIKSIFGDPTGKQNQTLVKFFVLGALIAVVRTCLAALREGNVDEIRLLTSWSVEDWRRGFEGYEEVFGWLLNAVQS